MVLRVYAQQTTRAGKDDDDLDFQWQLTLVDAYGSRREGLQNAGHLDRMRFIGHTHSKHLSPCCLQEGGSRGCLSTDTDFLQVLSLVAGLLGLLSVWAAPLLERFLLFRVHGDWVPLKVSLFEVEPQPARFASGYAGGDHVGGWSGSWDKQFNPIQFNWHFAFRL